MPKFEVPIDPEVVDLMADLESQLRQHRRQTIKHHISNIASELWLGVGLSSPEAVACMMYVQAAEQEEQGSTELF